MNNIMKYLAISGAGAIGVLGILLMVKAAEGRHHAGICEKAGKGIDERLKESIEALDKVAARVQTVFEHIKNPHPAKPENRKTS